MSVAVWISVTVFPLTAPLLNDFVSELYSGCPTIFIHALAVPRDRPSFPTRRSSDLAVKLPVAPPSAAVVDPLSVTVAVSLSVTLNDPLPVSVTDALLVVFGRAHD